MARAVGDGGPTPAGTAAEAARGKAEGAVAAAKGRAEGVKEAAQEKAGEVKEGAAGAVEGAKEAMVRPRWEEAGEPAMRGTWADSYLLALFLGWHHWAWHLLREVLLVCFLLCYSIASAPGNQSALGL